MAKEITITNANNLHSFISFRINGLKDGITVGIISDPNSHGQALSIAYRGETKIVPFNAKTEDLEELNSDENVVKPSYLEAFDEFIQDIYSNKVDTEKVEACKKIFEGIDKVDVEVDDELTKTKQALDVANEKLKHCANITVEELDELKGNLLIAYDALLHFSKDPIANNALKRITETKGDNNG